MDSIKRITYLYCMPLNPAHLFHSCRLPSMKLLESRMSSLEFFFFLQTIYFSIQVFFSYFPLLQIFPLETNFFHPFLTFYLFHFIASFLITDFICFLCFALRKYANDRRLKRKIDVTAHEEQNSSTTAISSARAFSVWVTYLEKF